MSKPADTSVFSDQEFDSIKAAVMETDRGRQFLSEFAQRNRVADTQTLLQAIQRLEDNIKPTVSDASADDDLRELALAIEATGEDICAVRNDMLKDTCAITNKQAVFASLADDAAELSQALIATAEALQKTVSDLRSSASDDPKVNELDTNVNELFETGWRQDVLAQRITKAMRLLAHLQHSLSSFSGNAGPQASDEPEAPEQPAAAAAPVLSPQNRLYFAEDEELFTAEPVAHDHADAGPALAADSAIDEAEPAAPEPSTLHARQAFGTRSQHEEADTETDTVEAADPASPDDTPQTNAEADAPCAPSDPAAPQVVVVRAGIPSAAEAPAEAAADIPPSDHEPAEVSASPEHPEEPSEAGPEASADQQPPAETNAQEAPDAEQPVGNDGSDDVMQAFSDFADAAPAPALDLAPEAPQPEYIPNAEDKERIVIIRKSASDKAEIPFADYLGLGDSGDPAGNSR